MEKCEDINVHDILAEYVWNGVWKRGFPFHICIISMLSIKRKKINDMN